MCMITTFHLTFVYPLFIRYTEFDRTIADIE